MKRDQLKKALIQAGVVSKDRQKEIRRETSTKRHIKRQRKKAHEHHLRIVCELCQKTSPDVEYYEHRNKMVGSAKWLCLRCADDNQIDDRCRQTAQSTQSKTKLFSRQHGRTIKL